MDSSELLIIINPQFDLPDSTLKNPEFRQLMNDFITSKFNIMHDSEGDNRIFNDHFNNPSHADGAILFIQYLTRNAYILSEDESWIYIPEITLWVPFSIRSYMTRLARQYTDFIREYAAYMQPKWLEFIKSGAIEKDMMPAAMVRLDQRHQALIEFAYHLGNAHYLAAITKVVFDTLRLTTEAEKLAASNTLLSRPFILPVQGGMVVDLRTMAIRKREKEDYCTRTALLRFTYESNKTDFENFNHATQVIEEIATKVPEKVVQIAVLLFMAIIGENVERAIGIVYGLGQNGKSLLFIEILKLILGPLFGIMPESALFNTAQSSHTGFLGELEGKYVTVKDEISAGHKIDTGKFKELANQQTERHIRGAFVKGNKSVVTKAFPVVLVNHGNITFTDEFTEEDKPIMDRLYLFELLGKFLWPADFDALTQEQKDSGMFIRRYDDAIIKSPEFLQGMLNYIVMIGGSHYWARKNKGMRAVELDKDKLSDVLRTPYNDFKNWFESVTTKCEGARISFKDLTALYRQHNDDKALSQEEFRRLLRKFILPKHDTDSIYRSSDGRVINQYFLRGYIIHGSITEIKDEKTGEKTRILSLGDYFKSFYEPCKDWFPFVEEVRLGYNEYLLSQGQGRVPILAARGFEGKLGIEVSELHFGKKQSKVNGEDRIQHGSRIWGWRKKVVPSLPSLPSSSPVYPIPVAADQMTNDQVMAMYASQMGAYGTLSAVTPIPSCSSR